MTNENINSSFKELGIIEPILKSIEDQHFDEPTEIQEKAIPLILGNKDVIGSSKTGSGKTLIFGCRIIQKSERGKGIQALILVPTRELAQQVTKSLISFSKYKELNIITVYGGVSINPQIDQLRNTDIVIGTPGRILDHLSRHTINFSRVNTLVLDEADMMLDMGFLPDVERIIKQIPKKRQTLLFSATISTDIKYITKKYMQAPTTISAEEYVDPSKLEQVYYNVPNNQKFSLLVHLLKEEEEGQVMIFCNTRENTEFVSKNLKLNGINSAAIHGGLNQNKRETVLQDFHKGKLFILLCTDVASRGLDIKGVSHVYNYDTCKDPKQYIHRIGRTARAGKNGKAITILAERDYDNFYRVMNLRNIKIQKLSLPVVKRAKIDFKSAGRSKNSDRTGFYSARKNPSTSRSRMSGSRNWNSPSRTRHQDRH